VYGCLIIGINLVFESKLKADTVEFTRSVNPTESPDHEIRAVASPLRFMDFSTGDHFTAFSVDSAHPIWPGATYSVTSKATPTAGSFTLNGRSVSSTIAQEIGYIALQGLSTSNDDVAAGAQLAIWSLLGGSSDAYGSKPKVNADRDYFLNNASTHLYAGATWLDCGDGPGQSLIFLPRGANLAVVQAPEFSSLAIMGIFAGAFFMGGFVRRLRRPRLA
jgi:hypothetical protein